MYISEVIRGGSRDLIEENTSFLLVVSSSVFRDDDANGYSIPNSEKYQSRISLEEISPTEITGLRSTAAENRSGNCPITKRKELFIQKKMTKI